ncbi:MAG: type II secretion system F family protein [Microthrixaceae bacterium]
MTRTTPRRGSRSHSPVRRARSRAFLLALAAVGFLIGLFPFSPASAQDAKDTNTGPTVAINRVDATGGKVRVGGWVTGGAPSDLRLTVGGKSVTPESASLNSAAGRSSDVMVVLDNATALGNATVQLSKKALEPLMPGAGSVNNLGVISVGHAPTVEQGLTDSADAVRRSLIGVIPDGTSQTWAGVRRAAEMLEDGGPNSDGAVVLIAASPMGTSDGGVAAATSALQRAGVEFHVIGLEAGADLGELSQVVADTGGTFRVVANDEEIAGAVTDLSTLISGRFTVTTSDASTGKLTPLTLTLGKSKAEVAFVPGALRTGATALAPAVATGGGISGVFASPIFKWLAVLLIAGAAVTLFWTVVSLALPDETNLVERLEVYEDPYGEKVDRFEMPDESHATVPIIRKAVELTGDIANKRGLTERLEFKLEQANVPLRAAEGMFFAGASSLVLLLVVTFLTRNILTGILFAALAIAVPKVMLDMRVKRRKKAFVAQLPDMLTLLAGTLRAGYSISQGFESVSKEIPDPMGRELRRVVSEARLGRSLEEALESVAERMESDDFAWAVMAIRIQREVGGNLAELLLTVAETMTQRERLRRDVLTLTAEGRISAIIIGFLPPALAAVMYVMNPTYIKTLFSPGLGYMLIGLAMLAMGIGFAWMKKTVTIEV